MKILITGANGQIGWELMQISTSHTVIGLTRAQLDLTQKAQIAAVMQYYQPDMAINAAAYTAVDEAEKEPEKAFAVNQQGVAYLAQACLENNSLLIHLSTDYVFSGAQRTPYRETDCAQPMNVYGESKLAGEQIIQQQLENYIILRVSSVFGEHGHNFVKTILRLAREREVLQVVNDIISCPTPAKDIAENLWKMIAALSKTSWREYAGIYHFCGHEPVTWHAFAQAIIAQASDQQKLRVQDIQAVSSAERPTLAKRPVYSVLETDKIQQHFPVRIPSWRKTLTDILPKLLHE